MNISDLPKWLAGNRPLAPKICAVLPGGREQALALGVNSGRWVRISNTLASLSAESVRLYDGADKLVASQDIEYDRPGGGPAVDAAPVQRVDPVNLQILKDASDVNALVHALAQAFATVVTNVSTSQAEAHKAAFHELREVNKIQADLIKSLRQQAEEALDAREDALSAREEELQEQKTGEAMMAKVLEIAGPEIAKKIFTAPAPKMGGPNGAPPTQ